jgi:hypothetical protein
VVELPRPWYGRHSGRPAPANHPGPECPHAR